MDWKKLYAEKRCTADEAVHLIKSGDIVVFAHAAAEPPVLVDALVRNKHLYENITVSHMLSVGKAEYLLPENSDVFSFRCLFGSANTKNYLNEEYCEYVPHFFYQSAEFFEKGLFPMDVFFVMVSPPNEDGYCCTGVSSDYTIQAIKSAKLVIAEVNDQVPIVDGDTFVHVSELDCVVETSHPMPVLAKAQIGEAERKIGEFCASLIEDGSTLQIGIGAIPDAVLDSLKDKKHLGIHSEMIPEGVVDLYNSGAIDGTEKSIDKGVIMGTFLMGTKKLYDFANNNPAVKLRTVDYVNHPITVAKSAKMVSINSCVEVDLTGQIASESIGTKQISGTGGQADFVRGASMSLDGKGKAIIALCSTSTNREGQLFSKIVPFLKQGAAVTTPRGDAEYIVTEYGIAYLRGKSLRERARALINIAHPDFREELIKAYEERFNCKYR